MCMPNPNGCDIFSFQKTMKYFLLLNNLDDLILGFFITTDDTVI